MKVVYEETICDKLNKIINEYKFSLSPQKKIQYIELTSEEFTEFVKELGKHYFLVYGYNEDGTRHSSYMGVFILEVRE